MVLWPDRLDTADQKGNGSITNVILMTLSNIDSSLMNPHAFRVMKFGDLIWKSETHHQRKHLAEVKFTIEILSRPNEEPVRSRHIEIMKWTWRRRRVLEEHYKS